MRQLKENSMMNNRLIIPIRILSLPIFLFLSAIFIGIGCISNPKGIESVDDDVFTVKGKWNWFLDERDSIGSFSTYNMQSGYLIFYENGKFSSIQGGALKNIYVQTKIDSKTVTTSSGLDSIIYDTSFDTSNLFIDLTNLYDTGCFTIDSPFVDLIGYRNSDSYQFWIQNDSLFMREVVIFSGHSSELSGKWINITQRNMPLQINSWVILTVDAVESPIPTRFTV